MILITGSTGNIGSELVQILSKKSVPLRVVARNADKVAHLNADIEKVIGELNDEETIGRALNGVHSLFLFPLVTEQDHATHKLIVEKAKKAGVKHIVMLSSLGAETEHNEIGVLHRQKEQIVENSGIAWTFLRPGAFMTNTLQWVPMIEQTGKVFSPTGDGKVAPISERDIAEVAAVVLTSVGHEGEICTLTGPQLLTAHEQVQILSKVTGRQIECVDIAISKAAEEMQKAGTPEFIVSALSKMWQQLKEGKLTVQTRDVEKLTGRPAEGYQQWAERHKQAFLQSELAKR